jgi:hypothetical protein
MTQSLECPHCHARTEARRAGWRGRSCAICGAPMILASAPAEAIVRRYLYGDRLADMGALPPKGRRG